MVTVEAPTLKPMIWLAIGLLMPFSVRVSVGFVAVVVSTQYRMGATFTTQSVPLQNEFVNVSGTRAGSTLPVVVRFSGSLLAVGFVPSPFVEPNVRSAFPPLAVAPVVKTAVVMVVPEVPV